METQNPFYSLPVQTLVFYFYRGILFANKSNNQYQPERAKQRGTITYSVREEMW